MNDKVAVSEPVDERRLLELAQRGDVAARNELVRRNLGLAGLFARRYARRNNGQDLDDLFQEAVIGLITAVGRFDAASHGDVSFTTYAGYWIRERIVKTLRRNTTVQVAAHAYRLDARWRAGEDLPDRLCAIVRRAQAAWADHVGLDGRAPASTDSDPAESMDHREQLALLARAFDQLDAVCRDVLTARYGLDGGRPRSLDVVARSTGLGVQAVKAAQARAIRGLEEAMRRPPSAHPQSPRDLPNCSRRSA
jgi:RNA polymerase primary sigma factor